MIVAIVPAIVPLPSFFGCQTPVNSTAHSTSRLTFSTIRASRSSHWWSLATCWPSLSSLLGYCLPCMPTSLLVPLQPTHHALKPTQPSIHPRRNLLTIFFIKNIKCSFSLVPSAGRQVHPLYTQPGLPQIIYCVLIIYGMVMYPASLVTC